MEYCNYQYNLSNDEHNYYIFEIKLKTLSDNKIILRKIKMSRDGNLINYDENIQNICSIKIKAYDLSEPNNEIVIKENISKNDNNILSKSKLLLQIHNNSNLVINYKFLTI